MTFWQGCRRLGTRLFQRSNDSRGLEGVHRLERRGRFRPGSLALPVRSYKGRDQLGRGAAKMAEVMAAPEAVAAPSSLLLLVVGGECGCPGLLAHILEELERGGAAGARAGGAAAGRGVRVGLGFRRPAGWGPGGAQRPQTQRSGRRGPRVLSSPLGPS